MIADCFRQRGLEIDEALVEGRGILAVQGDHLGPRLASADDLESILLHSLDDSRTTALSGSRVKPSSGPARGERIMGVSVAPG